MIIAHTGLLSIFPVFIGVMLVCTLCVLPISAEPIQTVKPQKNNLREYAALFRHKKFVSIYCTLALWGLAEAALTFLTLHLKNNDFNSRHIGLLLADAMAGEIAGFLLTVRLLKRIGPEKTIALSFVCQIIRSGSLAMLVPLPLMIVCQFIGGFSLPMIWASITYQVNETFPARIGNLAQGLKVVALNGLALLIGIPLCGILYQHVSSNSIFWMITAICVLYITGFCLKKAKRLTKFP
jgi:predicted MFS family arabinose efflux permease